MRFVKKHDYLCKHILCVAQNGHINKGQNDDRTNEEHNDNPSEGHNRNRGAVRLLYSGNSQQTFIEDMITLGASQLGLSVKDEDTLREARARRVKKQ